MPLQPSPSSTRPASVRLPPSPAQAAPKTQASAGTSSVAKPEAAQKPAARPTRTSAKKATPASPRQARARTTAQLARAARLVMVRRDTLDITRRRYGRGYRYFDGTGAPITDPAMIARLAALAVPPAYKDVRFAAHARAHLQAVGRDVAGRVQYRYHPDWEEVRGQLKAERLARFAEALPRIRKRVARDLSAPLGSRLLALAGVVELVTLTAIRPGEEAYARERGTRGAATLLKSNLKERAEGLELSFQAKGGRKVVCAISDPRFRTVVAALRQLPGRRLFQYRNGAGEVRPVRAGDVNAYLKQVAGIPVSLKDFRTLVASARVLEELASREPATSDRRRNAQILEAVRLAAETLHNTPAICRKSYVLPAVVEAFEDGTLSRFSQLLKRYRSPMRRASLLAILIRESA